MIEGIPLPYRELIPWLALAHGIFNSCAMAVFFYQGWLGLGIRRARKSSAPVPSGTVRRHRKLGPAAAAFGIAGFFIGMTIGILDKGRPGEYPLHFAGGLLLAFIIAAAYFVSRRIKGPDERGRNIHTGLGIALLAVYVVQAFLGLGILL